MISFSRFYRAIGESPLSDWTMALQTQIVQTLTSGHGDLARWQTVLAQLPEAIPSVVDLSAAAPVIGNADDLDSDQRDQLREQMLSLHPWRKGPFDLFGMRIDSEWRSDMKWARLADRIAPLDDRLVLDVGGGNGYYALRMMGAGARMVVSIDPTWLFVVQFQAIAHYLDQVNAHVIPLAIQDLPAHMQAFDTVFSMGVLYHRRSPITHLQELFAALKPGGQLVLETLVNHPGETGVLVPEHRYAKMRNVWFIPSADTLAGWLQHTGFDNVTKLDESTTTPEEQRRTDWMRFESLSDYLDPDDSTRTLEGYPAPRRAIMTAQKPQ